MRCDGKRQDERPSSRTRTLTLRVVRDGRRIKSRGSPLHKLLKFMRSKHFSASEHLCSKVDCPLERCESKWIERSWKSRECSVSTRLGEINAPHLQEGPQGLCQILLWWTSASKSQSTNAPTVVKWTRSPQVASWNEPKPVAQLAMEELDCQCLELYTSIQYSAWTGYLMRPSPGPEVSLNSTTQQRRSYVAETFRKRDQRGGPLQAG